MALWRRAFVDALAIRRLPADLSAMAQNGNAGRITAVLGPTNTGRYVNSLRRKNDHS